MSKNEQAPSVERAKGILEDGETRARNGLYLHGEVTDFV